MPVQWFFQIQTSSSGTSRSAELGCLRVEFNEDGQETFRSPELKDYVVPQWPGDENVPYGIIKSYF